MYRQVYLRTQTDSLSKKYFVLPKLVQTLIMQFSIVKPTRFTSFFNLILFYFCSSPVHVSNGLSVHHQVSKTVHTASGVCHTDSADCLLAVPADAVCTVLDS